MERNFASASWYSGSGLDGCFYLLHVDGVEVRDNSLYENVATLKANGGDGKIDVLVSSDTPDLTLTNNIIVSHTVGISVTEGTTDARCATPCGMAMTRTSMVGASSPTPTR